MSATIAASNSELCLGTLLLRDRVFKSVQAAAEDIQRKIYIEAKRHHPWCEV